MAPDRFSKQGFTLAAAVILIACASLTVLAVTSNVVGRHAQVEMRRASAQCAYSAQAGIQTALYWYRYRDASGNGYFSLGQASTEGGNYYALSATAADCLIVNVSGAYIGGSSNRYLYGVTVQNATNSKTITIDRMVVTWNNSRKLQYVVINGTAVYSGTASSPASIDISNFTLNTSATSYPVTYLRFSNSMSGSVISITFLMTDGSSRTVQVHPASQTAVFSLEATGKRTDAVISRTFRADYNALTSKIIAYRERNARLP